MSDVRNTRGSRGRRDTSGSVFRILVMLLIGLVLSVGSVVGETDDDQHTLARRLAAIEARVAALEAGKESESTSPNVEAGSVADSALLARLSAIEARLTQLEFRPKAAPAVVPVVSIAESVAEAESPSEPALITPVQPAQTIHRAGLFLPSRGTAGGALHYGGKDSKIDLHAFFDLEYIDAQADGSRGGVSHFDNHHANIFLRAQLRPNLIGHMEVEYEHSGETVEIDQAFVSWSFKDGYALDAGRFYTPFGIERFVWYSPTNALVSRPTVMREIVPGNFYANGVQASGLLNVAEDRIVSFEVAISDGLGDDALENRRGSRQTRDNNSSRAVSGRLAFAFWPRFEIGTSFHTQRYASDDDLDLTFLGLDLSARFQGVELRAEYVDANVERGSGLPDLTQDGWYLQAAYTFLFDRELVPELKLVTRWDEVNLDGDFVGQDDRQLWSFGLNAMLHDHLRVKAEYQRVEEEGLALRDDAFLLQVVLDY